MPRRRRVSDQGQEFGEYPKRTNSRVWNHFDVFVELITADWKKRVRCKECRKGLVFTGSTSSLRRHLEFLHPERFGDIQLVNREVPEFAELEPSMEEPLSNTQQVCSIRI